MKISVTFETEEEVEAFFKWRHARKIGERMREWEATEVGRYEWTTRTAAMLRSADLTTFSELSELDAQLLKLPSFGQKSLREVRDAVLVWSQRPQTASAKGHT